MLNTNLRTILALTTLALACLAPFIIFWDQNKRDLIDLHAVATYFAIALAAAFLFLGLSRLFTSKSTLNVANALSVAVLWIFLFGTFRSGISPLVKNSLVVLLLWLFVLIAFTSLAWRFARGHQSTLAMLAGVLVMMCAPGARLVAHTMAQPSRVQLTSYQGEAAAKTNIRPDIFFIILDGYARADILKEMLNYDNSEFLGFLESRGFYVASQATSNYPTTIMSVSSTLSMQYMQTEHMPPFERYQPYLNIMRGSNPVIDSLRAKGYRYVLTEPGHPAYKCKGAEDACIRSNRNKPFFGETEQNLLQLTPLHMVLERVVPRWYAQPSIKAYAQVEDIDAAILSPGTPSPYFVFAHLFAPHPPYSRMADCRDNPDATYDIKQWGVGLVPSYVGYLTCLNRKVSALIDGILQQRPDALIVLQSDHGSAFYVDWKAPLHRWSPKAVRERFAVLNAMRVPDRCKSNLYPSISLVNTFRIVLACLDGRVPDLLSDRSYISPDSDHKQFGTAYPVQPQ